MLQQLCDESVGFAGESGHASGELRSVLASTQLLALFREYEELGVSQAARKLGVAKSTAHRLLSTLCVSGLIQRDSSTSRYRLGLVALELGLAARERQPVVSCVMPYLEQLRRRTGLTVHFALRDGLDMVYVERLQSRACEQLFAGVARRFPVHATSSGKCMAAFDDDLARERIAAGLRSFTPKTPKDPRDFVSSLGRIREAGYALSVGETVDGLTSIAAPIRNYQGKPVAAVSVVGLTNKVLPEVEPLSNLVRCVGQTLRRFVN